MSRRYLKFAPAEDGFLSVTSFLANNQYSCFIHNWWPKFPLKLETPCNRGWKSILLIEKPSGIWHHWLVPSVATENDMHRSFRTYFQKANQIKSSKKGSRIKWKNCFLVNFNWYILTYDKSIWDHSWQNL